MSTSARPFYMRSKGDCRRARREARVEGLGPPRTGFFSRSPSFVHRRGPALDYPVTGRQDTTARSRSRLRQPRSIRSRSSRNITASSVRCRQRASAYGKALSGRPEEGYGRRGSPATSTTWIRLQGQPREPEGVHADVSSYDYGRQAVFPAYSCSFWATTFTRDNVLRRESSVNDRRRLQPRAL